MATLTGKTIGELTLLTEITSDTLFVVELSGTTYHIPYSGLSVSSSSLVDITYAELYTKVVNGELIAGSWYRLTDYKSVNFLNGWETANQNPTPTDPNFNPQEIYEGETEVLILQATSSYEIAEIGYSETFNGDIVQYQPFTNKIGVSIPNGIYNGESLPGGTENSPWNVLDNLTSLSQLDELNYTTFSTALGNQIGNYVVGEEMIMKSTVSGNFYKIVFTSWTQGNAGGGFSYDRQLITLAMDEPVISFTKTDYGDEVDVIEAGVLEIRRGNNQPIYNSAVEANSNGENPANTEWVSSFFLISEFDLQWDGTNVYFNMPTGYPALFGHYFYLYAEFQEPAKGPISSKSPNLSLSGDVTGLGGSYNLLVPTTLTGIGSGLVLDVNIKSDVITVTSINTYGDDYAIGDTLLIQGSLIGGIDGVNDVTIEVLAIDAKSSNYYQEGSFEPLTPNISICQYPSTSDDVDFGYPKAMSRIKVEDNGMKVILLDLTEADYNNYIVDTLYVETVYALGDAYGWISRRQDTYRNIDVPFDFRGRKYRRFAVDLNSINSSLGAGYWGIGDDFLGQGTTGEYKDFKSFANDGYEAYNIQWTDVRSLDNPNRGFYDNVVFLGNCYDIKIGSKFYQNTIGGDCRNNIFGDNFYLNIIGESCYGNIIGEFFYENIIGNNFFDNNISGDFRGNVIGDGFYDNTVSRSFFNNTIDTDFYQNIIGPEFYANIINNNFKFNRIGMLFTGNNIGRSFYQNTTNIGFGGNTIGDSFYNNTIGNGFSSNNIGNTFQSNKIEYSILSTDFSTATHVYLDYTCTIFKRSDGALQLSYIDGTNTVQYTAVNG